VTRGRPRLDGILAGSLAVALALGLAAASLERASAAAPGSIVPASRSVVSAGASSAPASSAAPAASASQPSSTASADAAAGSGDTRSPGQGPGFVGAPLLAILGVLAIGLGAAGLTLAYVRLTARRAGDDPDGDAMPGDGPGHG
jgi:hypothetical protein